LSAGTRIPADKHAISLEHSIGTEMDMSFDPETVSFLRSILSEVCASVALEASSTRTHVARRILEAAHCGTKCERELMAIGRAALLEAKTTGR
jgi:hypothetical protein